MSGAGHLSPQTPRGGVIQRLVLADAKKQRENRPPRLSYCGCSLPLTTELAMTHSVVSD